MSMLEKLQRMETIKKLQAYSMSKKIYTLQIGKRKSENRILIVLEVLARLLQPCLNTKVLAVFNLPNRLVSRILTVS